MKPSVPHFLVAAAVSFPVFPQSVKAVDACRGTNNYTVAEISASNFSCQKGDKIYSNFSGFDLFPIASSFAFNEVPNTTIGDQHEFQASNLGITSGTLSYSYTVAIAGSKKFASFETDVSAGGGASRLISKSLTSTPGETANLTVNGGSTNSTAYIFTTPNSGPLAFSGSFTVNGGSLNSFSDYVYQTPGPPPVPGPLPMLGAITAFGFTRRLRRRALSRLD